MFDEEFTDKFELYPVSEEFLNKAIEQWKIFRCWELQFHNGKEKLENHPGHGGINQTYDQLELYLKNEISSLVKIDCLFSPEFRILPGQENLPNGVLRETEVEWHVFT